MAVELNRSEFIQLRLHHQHLLTGGVKLSVLLEHLMAIQGQDFPAAVNAIALRGEVSVQDVFYAFSAGGIVRTWPMRSTVHLVNPADVFWIQEITNPRALKSWPARREYLGLDMPTLDRVFEVTTEVLWQRGALGRKELIATWQEAGIEIKKGWSYHLIWAICQLGLTVFGPPQRDLKDLKLVLTADWIKPEMRHQPQEPYQELIRRYAQGHAPFTLEDVNWWSGVPITKLRETFKEISNEFETVTFAGKEYLVPFQALETFETFETQVRVPEYLRLPAFDEYHLGFHQENRLVEVLHREKFMTKNGIARETLLYQGDPIAIFLGKPKTVQWFEPGNMHEGRYEQN